MRTAFLLITCLSVSGCAGIAADTLGKLGIGGGLDSMTARALTIPKERVTTTKMTENDLYGFRWEATLDDGSTYFCASDDERKDVSCRRSSERAGEAVTP